MIYSTFSRVTNGESKIQNVLASKFKDEDVTIQIMSLIKTSKDAITDPIIVTSDATTIHNIHESKNLSNNVLLFGMILEENENQIVSFDSPEIQLSTNMKEITLYVKNINDSICTTFQGFVFLKLEV